MQYLANKYSKEDSLYPKDAKARAMVDSRLHFDCGTLLPKIFENVLVSKLNLHFIAFH